MGGRSRVSCLRRVALQIRSRNCFLEIQNIVKLRVRLIAKRKIFLTSFCFNGFASMSDNACKLQDKNKHLHIENNNNKSLSNSSSNNNNNNGRLAADLV